MCTMLEIIDVLFVCRTGAGRSSSLLVVAMFRAKQLWLLLDITRKHVYIAGAISHLHYREKAIPKSGHHTEQDCYGT